MNVFTVAFDQFNESLSLESIIFFLSDLKPLKVYMDSIVHSQLCELGQLQAFNRKVGQSVPAQSEDLQTSGEVLKRPKLQMNNLIAAQVPKEMKYHTSDYDRIQCYMKTQMFTVISI